MHWVDVDRIHKKCSSDIAKDYLNFGISCTSKQLTYSKIHVDYPTDIYRLKQEAAKAHEADSKAQANADFLVIANATLLTMESGNLHHDVLRDAVIVTRSGKIEAIVGIGDADFVIPYGATVLDAAGGR